MTPTITATFTPTQTPSYTPTPTATTSTTYTPTATPTATATATATYTSTLAPTRTLTPTPTPASTASATEVPTSLPISTDTPESAATEEATATATATPIAIPSATSQACGTAFSDVEAGSPFYGYIQCLRCRQVASGYGEGNFYPSSPISRGQIAKLVATAAGFAEDPGPQIYQDVPPGHTYYRHINRLTRRGIVAGYPCPQRPAGDCEPENPTIFRPHVPATRGQLAKIVSNAEGFNEPPSGQFYADVPPGSRFYEWITRLTSRGVMSGYPCGTQAAEPCDSQNRPYFRPEVAVTRGQAAKIVANTFFPACVPR